MRVDGGLISSEILYHDPEETRIVVGCCKNGIVIICQCWWVFNQTRDGLRLFFGRAKQTTRRVGESNHLVGEC